MRASRAFVRRAGAMFLVALLAGACTSSSTGWPNGTRGPSTKPVVSATAGSKQAITPVPSGKRTPRPSASSVAATAAPVTVDQITVDYTYTSELITPIAHLYGTFLDDFAVVTIQNDNKAPVKVVVTTEIVGFTSKAIDTVTVAAGATEEVRQNPRLETSAIDALNSERPADFHIRVVYLDNGQEREALDQTNQTLVFGRRDFPWSIKGFSQDESFQLVASMVTPQDPLVEELIRTAANYDPSGAMTSGYGGVEDDADNSVWQRLDDIWQAETEDYSLTYISTPVTFAPGDTQRIRLPAEVLDQHSGNCIELALLYAATVEALGMQPVIVIIPGHAYVGVRTDDINGYYYFIETTMIGQATFKEAATYAGTEWDKAKPHVEANEKQYGWVSIADAREAGVLPIPWR